MNRRKFFSTGAVSVSGIALGVHMTGFTSKEKPQEENDLMKEVMKYRKIDSHAHVYFTADSPDTQIGFADRLGIEKLVYCLQ